jgi:glutathione synthase/RimK-type ligase-like ATP-grasp enzyme
MEERAPLLRGEAQAALMKIALIVARNHEELVRDAAELDEAVLLRRAFAELGVELPARSFHDPTVDWSEFDAVVPKAAWDYFHAPREFVTWLDRLTARGIRVINDAELIKWNHDKTYLGDLRDAGVPVAPFAFFPAGSDAAAVVLRLVAEGWRKAVIKPAISGGAWRTHAVDLDRAQEIAPLARDILGSSGLLAQPFFEEIPSAGEWSVLFVAGEPTHAVLKRPKEGDYRSQSTWGARAERREPPAWLVAAARRALAAAPIEPVYARVDGFLRGGELQLMELELIEPYFFLEHAPTGTAARLAEAIVATLRSG